MEVLILLFCIIGINSNLKIRNRKPDIKIMSSNDINIIIYVLDEQYQSAIQVPKDKAYYQIKAGSSGTYSVSKGYSVIVNKEGLITGRNVTWYWYGDEVTTNPKPDKTPDRTRTSNYIGISEVTAKVCNNTFKITVDVQDYSKIYVENVIDSYIKTKVNNKTTELEKFKVITAFPAQYAYGPYWNYTGMIIFKAGDCWASSFAIKYLCDKVGITAHIRYGGNDRLALSTTHLNAAALIDGKFM